MTIRETLERASSRGDRVRIRIAGEVLTGRPSAVLDRVMLFAVDPSKVPHRALFIAAIEHCEVVR